MISHLGLDPSSDQAFSISGPSSFSIPGGGSAQLGVDFEIASAAPPAVRKGTVTFQSNDPSLPVGAILLSAELTVGFDGGFPGCDSKPGPDFPPKTPLLPLTVPADCRQGFELNSQVTVPTTFTLPSLDAKGSRADLILELDFATYAQPDAFSISATDAAGQVTPIFGTCFIQTSNYADPSDGQHRPSEDAIRDFRVPVPTGTTALNFAFDTTTAKSSPWYVRIDGLCDFDLSALSFPGSAYRPFDDRGCLAGTCEAMSLCGSIVQHCGQSYDCSAAANCDGGLAQKLLDQLSSLDAKWTTFGDAGTSVSPVAGAIAVSLPASAVGVPAGLRSVQHYDAARSSPGCLFAHVSNAGQVADAGTLEAWLSLKDGDDNGFKLAIANGEISASLVDGSNPVTLSPASTPFSPSMTPDLTVCWNAKVLGFGSQATGTWTTVPAPGANPDAGDTAMGCNGQCGSAVSWLPVVQVELGAQRLSAGPDATVVFEKVNIGP